MWCNSCRVGGKKTPGKTEKKSRTEKNRQLDRLTHFVPELSLGKGIYTPFAPVLIFLFRTRTYNVSHYPHIWTIHILLTLKVDTSWTSSPVPPLPPPLSVLTLWMPPYTPASFPPYKRYEKVVFRLFGISTQFVMSDEWSRDGVSELCFPPPSGAKIPLTRTHCGILNAQVNILHKFSSAKSINYSERNGWFFRVSIISVLPKRTFDAVFVDIILFSFFRFVLQCDFGFIYNI